MLRTTKTAVSCKNTATYIRGLAVALVSCPECKREISDQAPACPGCGYQTHPVRPRFDGPPKNCAQCGGGLKKGATAKSEGSGCLIALIGLLLAPVLIGIPIVLYGVHLMSKREGHWRCRKCGTTFEREIKWYEFG